ncbi:MAG TPA: hypothetical protein VEC11_16730 [Allosphingosinicella sp.]|nr:hypothetical protein [Allosphingosinicella sp.]
MLAFNLLAALLQPAAAPEAVRLDLPGLSSPLWESHPAVDPLTGDLWFVRSARDFSGWRLFVSRCGPGGRSEAVPAPLAAPGLEADPWFSPDGRTLWYISSRATGAMAAEALDIWRVRRGRDGRWLAPERLPAPVNSDRVEWFPRPAADGWLYFGSRREGGLGSDDIWRARLVRGRWQVENAGPEINSAGAEYELQPSPDGRWALLATDGGIFRLERGPRGGWTHKVRVAGVDGIGPMITPDGRAFIFSRRGGDGRSGEFFAVRLSPGPAWPPPCPATRPGRRPPRR